MMADDHYDAVIEEFLPGIIFILGIVSDLRSSHIEGSVALCCCMVVNFAQSLVYHVPVVNFPYLFVLLLIVGNYQVKTGMLSINLPF